MASAVATAVPVEEMAAPVEEMAAPVEEMAAPVESGVVMEASVELVLWAPSNRRMDSADRPLHRTNLTIRRTSRNAPARDTGC